MRTYGLDIETHDPCLKAHGKEKARGTSWVFGEGEILVTGLYDDRPKAKKALLADGGETVRKLLTNPEAEVVGRSSGPWKSKMAVSVKPGHTQVMATPVSEASEASDKLMPTTACLDAP